VDNLALIDFDSEAKAYQALSELKQLHTAGAVNLHEAAVVQRTTAGLETKDVVGFDLASGTATGSIVGVLLGFLAGPLGVLLGWVTGGIIGASADVARTAQTESALGFLGSGIPIGTTALVAALTEPTTDAVDAMVTRLGGRTRRKPAEEVQAEIEAARGAEAAARDAAHRAMNEARGTSGEWHSRWEDVKGAFKRTFATHD
jgi:uncharacterized membrane protein